MSLDGHRARRRFSQNFLHDAAWIGRIAAAIDARPGQVLVEVGPGLGALTAPLLAGAGALTVVEIDRDLAARLRQRWPPPALTVLEADALTLDWNALLPGASLRIVGNLPYHISTPLLFALLPVAGRVSDQHFMLQKEVVDRIVALPDTAAYGRLSVMLQFHYRAQRLFDVPPGAFTPAPAVTSSIVRLQPRAAAELPTVDRAAFARVVAAAFSQRRKTLRNALASLLGVEQIRAAEVDPAVRGEVLDSAAFVRLARQVR